MIDETRDTPWASSDERLAALRSYRVLDTDSEEAFDRLVHLAAHLVDAPLAFLNFIDAHRQWSKAAFGHDGAAVPLDQSICVHTIQDDTVTVVEDLWSDPRFRDLDIVTEEGARFYAGAPLVTGEGHRLGTLCVADTEPRTLSDAERDRLRDLADVAVRELELRRTLQERKAWGPVRDAQNEVLEAIASGASLKHVLQLLVTVIEQQRPGMIGSILLVSEDGRTLRHGAAPSLPRGYTRAIDGVEIGLRVGACGTAAFLGEPVITEDVTTDPRWDAYRDLALDHGLRACWSVPILSEDDAVLGTFAFYWRDPRVPDALDEELAEVASRLASIAIERDESEQELRVSEARYRLLAENATDVVALHGADGTLLWVSPSARELLARAPADLVGRRPCAYVHPDDVDAVRDFHAALRDASETNTVTARYRTGDGAYRWLETLARPLHHDDGRVAQVQTTSRDVSERISHQEALLEAKKEAETMNRLKSAFLANMSHEIRTPLTSIIGFAEILEREADGSHRRMSNLIQRAGTRLMDTLDSVLQLSRLEAGAAQLTPEPVDVGQEMRETVELLRPRASEQNIDLHDDLPPEPVQATLDRAALNRIFQNVLGNALKFTDEGGQVTVRVRGDDAHVRIDVVDTGCGIGDEFLPQLFDAFKQEHTGARRPYEGSGLGLTVVKRLVDAHKGTIHVESEPGRGSQFHIRLPR